MWSSLKDDYPTTWMTCCLEVLRLGSTGPGSFDASFGPFSSFFFYLLYLLSVAVFSVLYNALAPAQSNLG